MPRPTDGSRHPTAIIIPFRLRTGTTWTNRVRLFLSASLDRLGDYLTFLQKETEMDDLKIEAPIGQPFMTMTRTFKAPRALVWKAISEPEHAVRWWGPHGYKNEILQFDWSVPGQWRVKTTTNDGAVIEFFGDYLEIQKPEKVTQTFSFDQLPPGAHSIDTVVLEDHGDTTVYRASSTLPDVESRDAMIASGMEKGIREGFERLDQMLEEWKVTA